MGVEAESEKKEQEKKENLEKALGILHEYVRGMAKQAGESEAYGGIRWRGIPLRMCLCGRWITLSCTWTGPGR